MTTLSGVSSGAFWRNLDLTMRLVKRDVLARYQGSLMGTAWSFLVPLLMLAIYTFVFSGIFRMRWADATGAATSGSALDFSLILFVGLIVHSFASEVLTRSPTIIIGNTNLVKRVVFPLDVLPLMAVVSALIQFFISLMVFLVFFLFVQGLPPITVLWIPVIILPFAILMLGCAWFLAGATVYLRDLNQLMGLAATALLFLSPIFYPASLFPESLAFLMHGNPLTFIIEQARLVTFGGSMPDLGGLALYTAASLAVAALGRFLFMIMRRGFSDVL